MSVQALLLPIWIAGAALSVLLLPPIPISKFEERTFQMHKNGLTDSSKTKVKIRTNPHSQNATFRIAVCLPIAKVVSAMFLFAKKGTLRRVCSKRKKPSATSFIRCLVRCKARGEAMRPG